MKSTAPLIPALIDSYDVLIYTGQWDIRVLFSLFRSIFSLSTNCSFDCFFFFFFKIFQPLFLKSSHLKQGRSPSNPWLALSTEMGRARRVPASRKEGLEGKQRGGGICEGGPKFDRGHFGEFEPFCAYGHSSSCLGYDHSLDQGSSLLVSCSFSFFLFSFFPFLLSFLPSILPSFFSFFLPPCLG